MVISIATLYLGFNYLKGKDFFLKRLEKSGGNKKIKNKINAYFRFSEFMFNAPYLFAVGVKSFESLSDILLNANILPSDKNGFVLTTPWSLRR